MLSSQLASMKLNEKENIVARFEDGFKQMWVNNGNALSKLYAGTGALSQGGSKLMDGARSAARTIQNNLLDKDKQSAYDLLLHGTVRNTDLADRARLLLPMEYWNGEHSTLSHFTLYHFICQLLCLFASLLQRDQKNSLIQNL